MDKICTTCKTLKNVTEFNKKKSRKDGLQSACKDCSREKFKKYYYDNYDKHIEYVKQYKKEHREEFNEKIKVIKTKYGCALCDEIECCCLDFHHYNGAEKDFNISKVVSNGTCWDKIIKEVNKCVLLCSNCHRKVHYGLLEVNENMKCVEI